MFGPAHELADHAHHVRAAKKASVMGASQVRALLQAEADKLGSRKALAAKCGVSGSFLSDIMNGKREPSGKPLTYLGLARIVRYWRIRKRK